MPPTAIALLAAAVLYVGGTLLARRLRDWHGAEWMHLAMDSMFERELPSKGEALGPQVIAFIRHQAEAAALDMALHGRSAGNPHAARTRAHVLWETSYQARLLYLTQRRSPRTVDLAGSIDRIRADRRA